MKYFAYGSNMSGARLRARVPGARRLGVATLRAHALRFNKKSVDGSGKCDACHTGNVGDRIIGVLFEIDSAHKPDLDRAEELGSGYQQKTVTVITDDGTELEALTYYAIRFDDNLRPYSWYLNHVLIGAREAGLPEQYIRALECIDCIEDPNREREQRQRAVHSDILQP